MGDVSQHDDEDRPGQPEPGRDPSSDWDFMRPGGEQSEGDQAADFDDTQPLYGEPSAPDQPDEPDPGRTAPPTTAYPVQPPPGYPDGSVFAGQQQQWPPRPGPQPGDRPAPRFPGWFWPVVSVVALLLGLLGGVLGGVAVSTSMSSDGIDTVPVIGTDNQAARPLDADNGSISAVAARVLPSTVQIQANGGAGGTTSGGATGSGFVLDGDGHVITNNHVVADATGDGEIEVVEQDGTKHAAEILGRSPVYDIAVLDVADADGLKAAAIGSSRGMRVGDTVVAIGSPLGLNSTVTSGIVSATDRPVTTGDDDQSSYINAVQTDAAINPGNSGGPLVNMRGQVVGVNSAIATTGGVIGGDSGNIGVGFAIPMEQVRVTATQILATGKARYPVIGANVNTGRQTEGAEVVEVPSGTPADEAGLEEGDVVVQVDGKPVDDGIGLIVAIRSHQPGETVTLTVRRGGDARQVQIKLDSKVG
jgi:putative serine protease PepD